MKKIIVVAVLISVIIYGNARGEKINLICTGEESYYSLKVKTSHSFTAMIDFDTKDFSITLIQNADGERGTYPKENPFIKANCPTPMWDIEITETEIRIMTACNKEYLKRTGWFWVWEIRRTDGSFTLFSLKEERAKGKCVKSSEKAF